MWTIILPEWFLIAAREDGIMTQSDVDDLMGGRYDGIRPGVLLAGRKLVDASARSRYADAIFTAWDDRDIIGASSPSSPLRCCCHGVDVCFTAHSVIQACRLS
jgi:hypothetical protein